jgi:hypothetical protein
MLHPIQHIYNQQKTTHYALTLVAIQFYTAQEIVAINIQYYKKPQQ